MTAPVAAPDAELTGRRVEELLDRLIEHGDAATAATAEELVRVLMDFYGAGLARIMHLVERRTGADGPRAALLGDALVSSLLVLHDLHPEDAAARIDRALASVRSQDAVEVAEFAPEIGELRLTESGSGGCGCGGAVDRPAVEGALSCFAPEVTSVAWETRRAAPELPLLQISRRPPTAAPVS
ncbi:MULTISPECIES: hypothetical protein [Streptomyces]|uniref:Thioredoxin n=2 Tax=Streptomyces TaxID=1883 RepID=A0A2N8P909_STRNR|nr:MULTISPECIES: hypothetical protein [Streptomyces]PNE37504.1 hypothetical protein AOB60_24715 [Streptomyces noursei]SHM17482.1 hypothetical protein SAMN05216268_10915 [Streptomyces yunnanensis]